MIGQTQEFLKENGQVGDCWRCCIAAVLNLDIAEVPHFLAESKEYGSHADSLTQSWLYERGYVLIEAPYFQLSRREECPCSHPVICCGPTPRSKTLHQHHAVIMHYDKLLYDPHPSGLGLTAVCTRYMVMPVLPTRHVFGSLA